LVLTFFRIYRLLLKYSGTIIGIAIFVYNQTLFSMKKFLFLCLFVSFSTIAQKVDLSYYLPKDVSYDKSIPTPVSVIGHEVGEWHITHDKLVEYMKALAASSDRINIEFTGKTFEDRPLLLLTITSPKNHQNLENIRKDNHSLSFILQNCVPEQVEGNLVTLAFKYKFHADRINDMAIKIIVEKALGEIFKSQLTLITRVDEKLRMPTNTSTTPAKEETPNQNPAQKGALNNLLNAFGGEVIS
jgi:hypothetical protein